MVELAGEVLKVASTQGHVSVNVPTLGFGEISRCLKQW